ncbi:acyl-CoA dehydrogenase [Haloactinomyces albus]|uniref:Alkylation response protein AidB-like acyl-CoA dehydrogenase n=1 Tax=Haloactinomyces albus TaxID=1352928 RepID=A0AAE3ZFE8_9ACTN|nr:acyl-CoA dehydrogenase [Haloactinomyces albus]MDR7303902.1 alkylation response protein AidB-like acyl-CoA dehydrogenase [Haloactinomyces albus]
MTIGLTEEHRDLRDSVRALTSRHITTEVIRETVEAKTEQLPAFWSRLAEQGLLGLHLPEAAGGSGYGLLELVVVAEELGRGMVPGPFLPTVLTSAVLHRAGHGRLLPELAEGTAIGAVALRPGSLILTRTDTGEARLSGEPDPVLGGHLADHFVLPARDGDGTTWVVLPRNAVETVDLAGHDLTRRLSRLRADGVTVPAGDVLDVAAQVPVDLAATLFAAEASGLADWASTTAAEYAKVRHQFGRPVGQFQGVKHRCARMLTRAEQARVCVWDAARANQPDAVEDRDQASLAAAVAGATSVEASFCCTKDCIQTLGGIGFTWEHEANLYLRRSQTLRLLLGSTAWWRRRVARLTLAGTRREPGIELPPEAERVRAEVRAELAPATELDGDDRRSYLAEHGYTAPHLPFPWGKGADAVSQLVIDEELRAAELTTPDMVIGAWVVPTLIAHGTSEQQQWFLPATLRGDIVWCQLFSEPGAGSDLAGLSTRAEKVDGGWKINGQKVWTSMAREAHHGILLARTDPSAPKHKGLSYFMLDMSAPGIDIRPLREITGDALFNEVFFDDVFIPDEMLVAEPGDGWKLARTTLANERVSLSHNSSLGSGGEALLAIAAGTGFELDDERLTTLGGILCDAQSGGLFGLRSTIRSLSGQQPGAESSVAKLIGVEHVQQVWETAMDWAGAEALSGNPERHEATWMFLNSRCMSIAGGTTDVQLNIIGERLLGLPRDPEPAQADSGEGQRS